MSNQQQAAARFARVRQALVGMIGSDDLEELRWLETDIQTAHEVEMIDDEGREKVLEAIRVLIEVREDPAYSADGISNQ
jgi:hypothetical protein